MLVTGWYCCHCFFIISFPSKCEIKKKIKKITKKSLAEHFLNTKNIFIQFSILSTILTGYSAKIICLLSLSFVRAHEHLKHTFTIFLSNIKIEMKKKEKKTAPTVYLFWLKFTQGTFVYWGGKMISKSKSFGS